MFDSLVVFVKNLREKFHELEENAKNLGSIEKSNYSDSMKRKIIKKINRWKYATKYFIWV